MKLLSLLLVSATLVAGTPDTKWSWGPTGSVNWATSPSLKEISNEKPALAVGAHVSYKLSPKQVIRLRGDYTAFPSHLTKYPATTFRTKAISTTTEVDYLLFPKKNWYLTVGAGASFWSNQFSGYVPKYTGRKNYVADPDTCQPLVTAGTGYVFPVRKSWVKSVALEARLLSTQLSGSLKSNTAQAGLVVSF
jgi:hypothetical protein